MALRRSKRTRPGCWSCLLTKLVEHVTHGRTHGSRTGGEGRGMRHRYSIARNQESVGELVLNCWPRKLVLNGVTHGTLYCMTNSRCY